MSTEIQWTDETWNPVTGCTKVSPGCAHCYAEGVANRFWVKQYPWISEPSRIPGLTADSDIAERPRRFTDVWCHDDRLAQPLRWKQPRKVFVNSMSDLFHEAVPDQFLHDVYHVMEHCRQHQFQILTKRAERMRDYLNWRYGEGRIPSRHIWHGVSVENQEFLSRIDCLKDARSAVRFVSFEPLLTDLGAVLLDGIQWAIIGGESGGKARPCDVAWVRALMRQCQRQGVAVFVKQLGRDVRDRNDAGFEGDTPRSWPMDTSIRENLSGFRDNYQGAPVRVRLQHHKGGDMAEWPVDLRVRQFPMNQLARQSAETETP